MWALLQLFSGSDSVDGWKSTVAPATALAALLLNACALQPQAPEPVAWPAPYAGCVGAPSAYACGSRYELGKRSPALP